MLRHTLLGCAALLLATTSLVAQKPPVNLTGTWAPGYWTLKIALQQEGERVWGRGGNGDFWFRGRWDDGRLLLVATNFDERRKGVCNPRGVFIMSGTTVNNVTAEWRRPGERALNGGWKRLSPAAGDPIDYPYATELEYCGTLTTYELAFASGSDKLTGTEWPILAAVADVLKQKSTVKIEVAGHTDSTGEAAANQALSERRAAAVKQALVEKYGADAARISTRGWGAEQPIEDNKTEGGRALNRRVEIVLAQ